MTLGLAMIVKNGADTMEAAINPFMGVVDEISIVLGGVSTDDTAKVAEHYATIVGEFSDTPFHFGNCRQQSFDQLSTDWIIVVDADDVWGGVEHLESFIDEADEKEADAIYVLYHLNGAEFYQPRIYRRGLGQWIGAVHELYQMPPKTKVLKTADLSVTQIPDKRRKERALQNIAIGEQSLKQDANNLRTIAHLIKDYLGQSETGRAFELCQKYLEIKATEPSQPGHYDSEYLGVLHAKAEIELLNDDYESAAFSALKMLQVKASAAAWAVLAESVQKMAYGSKALLQLSIFAADQALFSGKTQGNQIERNDLRGSIPCLIKAMALHELGDDTAAIQMADLGRLIDPDNKQLESVHRQLSERVTNGKHQMV